MTDTGIALVELILQGVGNALVRVMMAFAEERVRYLEMKLDTRNKHGLADVIGRDAGMFARGAI
jgi:hypothetical protein